MRDTLDKIFGTYFSCITDETFIYKGKTYDPHPISISPLIFRGYNCYPGCGACCFRFSLDYLPFEERPHELPERQVEFNGKKFLVFSDLQLDHEDHYCRNLDKKSGLCGVHGKQPFSCDFELLRFIQKVKNIERPNRLLTKLYGRGWNMLRIDGERGAICDVVEVSEEARVDVVRRLARLKTWVEYFCLDTKIDKMLDYCRNVPLEVSKPYLIGNKGEGLEGFLDG